MPVSTRTRRAAASWAIVSGLMAAVAGVVLHGQPLSAPIRLVLAVAPVAPMAWYCVLSLRALREMDELEARIQLEGAVYGLLGSALLIMAGGLLTTGGILPGYTLAQAWPWLWISAFTCWALGCGLAGRRYR